MIFDLLIKNAIIFPESELKDIYIKSGKFDQIEPSAKKTSYPALSILNLREKTLIPAFTDAHTHFFQWSLGRIQVSLEQVESYDDALNKISAYLSLNPDTPAVIATDFDQYRWIKPILPSKKDLDKISTSCPIVMRRICGHLAVFNSPALKKIENLVDKRFIDFKEGIVVEDPVLKIYNYFPPSPEMINQALQSAQQECFRQGISAVGEITSSLGRKIIARASHQHQLKVKFRLSVNQQDFKNLQQGGFYPSLGDGPVSLRALKIFLDGSIGGKTAAVSFVYKDAPASARRGILLMEQNELGELLKSALNDHWKIWIHAIGDRAIDLILSSAKKLHLKNTENIRIEHFELPSPEAIDQVADMGIQLCVQPNFINNWSFPGQLYQQVLPDEIYRFNNPLKEILNRKCNFCFGSDNMPANPFYGIQGTVNSPLPVQRLSLTEAIKRYTFHSARCLGDTNRGKIIPGFQADIAVLNQFPDENNLLQIEVEQMYIDGEKVYDPYGES
ncbi:MAG: amidohydrolase [bacterium]